MGCDGPVSAFESQSIPGLKQPVCHELMLSVFVCVIERVDALVFLPYAPVLVGPTGNL